MAITTDPFLRPPGPISEMTPEEKLMAEIERRVAEQIEKQRSSEVGRRTFAKVPGAISDPLVKPERFNIIQDMQGNYWNRIQRFAGGPLVIERLRSEYTPADQRKIEKLYRDRSAYATDPDLNPEESKAGMDKADAMISRVPKMPPIMRVPTFQQKLDAVTVTTADGTTGTFDPKTNKFSPFESSKAQAELEKAMRTRVSDLYNQYGTEDDKRLSAGDITEPRSPGTKTQQALTQTRIEFGLQEERWPSINSNMDGQWEALLAKYGVSGGMTASKMTGEILYRHIEVGKRRGLSLQEAKDDLFQRWLRGNQGGRGFGQLPRMSDDIRKKIAFVQVDAALSPNDPDVAETLYGKTISTLPAKPIPPGMEAIWDAKDAKGNPILTEEVKTDIQSLLMEGKTVPQILAMLKKLGMI